MRENKSSTLRIWWMNPAFLFLMIMSIVLTGAYFIPAASYLEFYRVTKFINETNIMYAVLPALFFIIGSLIASLTTKGIKPSPVLFNTMTKRSGFMRFCIYALFACTMFGYMMWFLIMLRNGFSLGLFLDVLKGEPGAIYQITENFETVAGVTSFTNFGIPFVILAFYYQCFNKSRTFLLMIMTVCALTLVRSIFFSERLAILEIIVPATIVYLAVRYKEGRKIPLVSLYPLVAGVLLVGFFGISEYFRSWLSYYVYVYPSFWEFVITRMFGYYVTAMNTGVLYIEQLGFQSMPFPYFTWEWIWKFPGLPGDAYSSLFHIVPDAAIDNTLSTMGNPEFNNPSGLLLPYHDYGLAGSMVYWLIIGFVSGLLYTWFKNGHTFGMLLYPIWMVGIMELPRYLYFSSGRFFPCWIVLLVFTLVIHYNKSKIKSWQLAGVRGR